MDLLKLTIKSLGSIEYVVDFALFAFPGAFPAGFAAARGRHWDALPARCGQMKLSLSPRTTKSFHRGTWDPLSSSRTRRMAELDIRSTSAPKIVNSNKFIEINWNLLKFIGYLVDFSAF